MRPQALLIGYGNLGRGDDGLGPAFTDLIERRNLPFLDIDTDYQLTVDHALAVADSEMVIFADALIDADGPFTFTKTEAGMAVVIAHEVAHALARHGAERMSDQMVASVGTAAASVALAATVSGRSRTYLPAMMAAVGAGATVGYILPMSRAQESEADRIGLVLMALAGYDPREAIGLWERMRAASSGKRQAEWLSTHPADTTRIADIRRWLPEAMQYYRPR